VLRTFLADRNSHLTLATFVGTFTFSVVVLRAVGAEPDRRPVVSVTVAQLLMLLTIGMLVQYVNHITRKIRVSSILSSTMTDTLRAMEAESGTGSPLRDRSGWTDGRVVESTEAGFLAYVDREALVDIAADAGGWLRLLPRPGDFVAAGEPLLEVWGLDPDHDDQLLRRVQLGDERQLEQDTAYGVRQLLDIALRALSPSLNDPTTAAQAVDHLRNVLVQLHRLGPGGPVHRDAEDRDRLLVPRPGPEEVSRSAVDELRRAAADQPQVLTAVDRLCGSLAGEQRGQRT
jgi:uncharacterized membrane protein